MMKLQLLRNATQLLKVNGKNILIDPMLAPKESYDPFMQTNNTRRNPLVDLPLDVNQLKDLINRLDAVLLTHIHPDHWDQTAMELLPKDITLFCQPVDAENIRQAGFTNIYPVEDVLTWHEISFSRTGGRHGTGEIGERMGTVSGYVISFREETLYIAGDTIWCEEVSTALEQYKPTHIVLNGGAARFIVGDPIVMDIKDIIQVCNYAPGAKKYVVHLEAVNHGTESREQIRAAMTAHGLCQSCLVPKDGEFMF